ncbi:MAG: alpha/beta hydrolase [Bacteroidetes bacterium]|nr:alpha/beta hydrolase [Bacteroidota bacterium]
MTYHTYPPKQASDHWILAFYGFGQEAQVYSKMIERTNERFGFVVVDLPYQEFEKAETKTDFLTTLTHIINENKIKKLSGISYSMGSRYNLILAELIPNLLDKLILIAPDGIHINFWNQLATSSLLGKPLFKYLMHHPEQYTQLLNILYWLHFLPRNIFLFSKMHTRDVMHSKKVYNTWMNMKNMIPNLQKIKAAQEKIFHLHPGHLRKI